VSQDFLTAQRYFLSVTTAPTPAPARAPLAPLLLALFALYVIWGSTYYAIRVALVDLPPLGMAGVRFLIAGALLYAFERLRGQPNPPARMWAGGALMGLLLLGFGNALVVLAQRSVASSLAAVAVATMPLFAGLWSRLLGEAPSRSEWVGLVVGFVGVVLLSGEGDFRASPLGALLLLAAPASWALGSVLSRRLTLASGFMGSAVQMLMGGAIISVGALLHGERWPTQVGAASLGAFAYLVVFGSILAFSAYVYLLRNTRTAVATSYAYVNPVIAIAIGMSIGGERIGVRGLIGAGVILCGVLLVTLGRARSAPQPASTPDAAAPTEVVGTSGASAALMQMAAAAVPVLAHAAPALLEEAGASGLQALAGALTSEGAPFSGEPMGDLSGLVGSTAGEGPVVAPATEHVPDAGDAPGGATGDEGPGGLRHT